MATLSLTILPAKALKSGKHKVRIAVAHNSQTRYILTDVVIDSIKEFKNGQIVKRGDATYLNTKLRKKLDEVQRTIDTLPYIEGLSCPELISAIDNAYAAKNHTLRTAFDEMMEVATAKASTINLYHTIAKSVFRSINEATPVCNVTPFMLRKYIKDRSDLSVATLKGHVRLLAAIFNYCQQQGYTDFRVLPTANILSAPPVVRQNWLSPEQVRFIRDEEIHYKARIRFRDYFMLSYYLGGINAIDLAKINFNVCHDTLSYIRTKTERKSAVMVQFDIPDVAKEIIDRYKGDDGMLSISSKDRWYVSNTASYKFLRDKYEMPNLTFYSARKSFAQHAFSLGVSESVIDYILGHSQSSGRKTTLYAYIKVTPDMASEAIRKVCDFIASDRNF